MEKGKCMICIGYYSPEDIISFTAGNCDFLVDIVCSFYNTSSFAPSCYLNMQCIELIRDYLFIMT